MTARFPITLLFVLLIVLAGCGRPDPPPGHNSVTYYGTINTSDGLEMHGNVAIEGASPLYTYQNVTVNYYSADKDLIHREHVGSLGKGTEFRREISVNLSTTPAYITIESPDFWQHSDGIADVDHYCWNDSDREYERVRIQPASAPICGPLGTNTTSG